MNQLVRLSPALTLPALVATAEPQAQRRFLEFFAAAIRNAHTRKAYMRAAGDFLAWFEARQVRALVDIEPLHVAAWIEETNGGSLEKAAAMANHASTRTTQLYDRRGDEVNLDEVERVVI